MSLFLTNKDDFMTNEWFWEGNVQDQIADYLKANGWTVDFMANAAIKQRGIDIDASRGSERILIEVKGYPAKHYQSEARRDEKKRTNPTLQAPIWYAQALLKIIRLQNEHPGAKVAIGLPNFPRYRKLFVETRNALAKLDIPVFLVNEDGRVALASELNLDAEPPSALKVSLHRAKDALPVASGTIKQRVLTLLQCSSSALCDDCLASRLHLSACQSAYQACNHLFDVGQIQRGYGQCAACFKGKTVNQRLLSKTFTTQPLPGQTP